MSENLSLSSSFKAPIRISDAIALIDKREFLLPAIQRKFVWPSDKIEVLFDSIMRDYPINSFMIWHVTSDEIKNRYKFYEFLKCYREFFSENNPEFNTVGHQDFMAIIDGQQRLTALYIGLKGSFAYRAPRKWLKDNEESLPTRRLYLCLNGPLKNDERKMIYDFKILSERDVTKLSDYEDLFLVQNILNYRSEERMDDFLDSNNKWTNHSFAKQALRKLRKVVFDTPIINYYQEENQDLDTVLDIFIRTNSGGQPLSFSNLLMSITTANWKLHDARDEFEKLIKTVYTNNFVISGDWILKCCLVLFHDNIKFKVANFDVKQVEPFDTNWSRIKECVTVSFELLSKWGFNDSNLRAKNAVIPIVFYLFHHNIEKDFLKDHCYIEEKKAIRKWLCISLLKGVFGGQSDSVLMGIRKVLKNHLNTLDFPFDAIKAEFANNDAKSLSFSDEVIEGILRTQKGANAYPILALLYSHLHYDTVVYHQDHLHPESKFKKLKPNDLKDEKQFEFYNNPDNWNSILNLQLLSSSTNESKNDEDLDIWVKTRSIDKKSHLIPEDASLAFKDFPVFIAKRKELLSGIIKELTK